MDINFEGMTPEQIYELIDDAQTELGRRQTLEVFDSELATVITKARSGGVIEDRGHGEVWVQPTGYHNAYVKGDVVAYQGKEWESLYTGNDQEPGVRGWHEILPPDEDGNDQYPVWKLPQGYEESYDPGQIVWYPDENGQLYKNVHTAGNSWEPGTPGSQWEPYTPDDDAS